MNRQDAFVIGVCQGIAIIPGVSRSGLTLSGSLSRGLERGFAARFSFLLSIPAILGALVLQLKDLVDLRGVVLPGAAGQNPVSGGAAALNGVIGPAALIAGPLTAAVVGFFSVKFMLKIVRERSLTGFAVYTAVLGLLVLADQYISHFFF